MTAAITDAVARVQWQSRDLMSTASCLGPWTACCIPVPKDAGGEVEDFQLDFIVKGPREDVDKPQAAAAYHLDSPGGYKLSLGNVRPFPQANLAPFMLVCPLMPLSPSARCAWPLAVVPDRPCSEAEGCRCRTWMAR